MANKLDAALKQAGYSLTKPRQAVFEFLEAKGPVTLLDLNRGLLAVDRSSIYRTVSLFENLSIVRRVQQGWKYKLELTDEFIPHHHHFICERCGRLVNFDEPAGLDALLNQIEIKNNFDIKSHSLEVAGLCLACKA